MCVGLIVERMSEDEAPEVARLVAATIQPLEYYNERAKIEETAKYAPDRLLALVREEADAVLVARLDGRIVGYCISRYDDGLVWLSWFGVDADQRGRGIGQTLLHAVAETLPSRRAHKMWCDTRTDNVKSQRVLTRFGFSKIGHVRNHWYGQDFYLWEWAP